MWEVLELGLALVRVVRMKTRPGVLGQKVEVLLVRGQGQGW